MQPAGHHIAEFNIGVLKHDWDDRRVADFVNNTGRVSSLARRTAGFVWMMDEFEMDAAQQAADGVLGGNPRHASTLSVWEDLASLEHFVWNTIHKKFYDRRHEWFDEAEQGWGGLRLVMWHVPIGHTPALKEAVDRMDHLAEHGDSDHAFGWAHARQMA